MKRLLRAERWLRRYLDYRTFAALAALMLLAGVLTNIATANRRADDALRARDTDRQVTTQRIDTLTAEIRRLSDATGEQRETIAALNAQVAALAEQVRQMGGRPVVAADTRPEPSPAPGRSPDPPSPAPTPSPSPTSPAPSPPPCGTVRRLLGRCP